MSFLNDFIDHLSYLLRRWMLKKDNQMVVIRGSCGMCGNCCRGISLHIDGKWLKHVRQFNRAKNKYEYLRRFEVIGKTASGHLQFACRCLNENGTCDDYENRPELCKLFPSPSIYAQNGHLPDGCGFRMSTEVDFEKLLDQAVKADTQCGSACFSNISKSDNKDK
ncbi:YkgJ family cysteine cluster protein [Maridesulfovibrio sp. FT414]|uniref:YkgJ family cysteine cluster protein n=1 Tax=Maridesulfovibrio sp. FT414 TaxID=2979469 RepID=UPI003D802C80